MRLWLMVLSFCSTVSNGLGQNVIAANPMRGEFTAEIIGTRLGAVQFRMNGFGPGGASANVKFKLEGFRPTGNFLVVSPSTCVTPCEVDIGVNPNLVGLGGPGRLAPISVDFVTVDQTPVSRSGISVTVTLGRPPSPVLRTVVNAASLEPAISPGALVSVLGSNLAPTLSASFDSGGLFPTTLGGTSVTFNGIPAFLISTSAGRINAVAPYQLAGQQIAEVVVRYFPGTVAERTSAPFSVPVAGTSLAIFTSARTGSGESGILNCEGEGCTVNQPQNPTPPGSIVSMFGTAAGIWTNSPPDGSVAVRARSLDYSQVSLTIGGQPARILYAGTAPFQVWGVFQVNAVVPAGLPPGSHPVVLTVGQLSNAPESAILFVGEPYTTQPVSVTIGGQPAKAVYAGTLGAQSTWSVLQVNAVIPDDVSSGPQPVVLKIGANDNSRQKVMVCVQ